MKRADEVYGPHMCPHIHIERCLKCVIFKLQQHNRVPQLEDVFVFPEWCRAPENPRIESFNYRVSEPL